MGTWCLGEGAGRWDGWWKYRRRGDEILEARVELEVELIG